MKLQTQPSHTTPHPNPKSIAGFTLVELSIVLVILGLLVGGVLAGQSLIRAAELRSVTREFQSYQTALGTFKDKYFAVPGDMNNAVRYWGAQAGGTADGTDGTCTALTTAATGIATCNGDGNGLIQNAVPTEQWRAWQHLANAGLIEGAFSGITGSGSAYHAVIGTNVPRSKLSGGGWTIYGVGTVGSGGSLFPGNYRNALELGAQHATYSGDPILKPEEAYNIDTKLDDGRPHTGIVSTENYATRPDCIVAANDAYSLSTATKTCAPWFITGY